jgi:putative RecB family exonuclease
LRYLDKVEVEEMSGIEAFMGSKVHETLQHLYEAGSSRTVELEELIDHLDTIWLRDLDDSIKVLKKGACRDDYLRSAKGMVRSYYDAHRPFDQGSTVGLEHNINFKLHGKREDDYTGYIDRLTDHGDGILEIIDYKTGQRLPTLETLKKDRQLALYEAGVRADRPDVHEVRLTWHYLAHGQTFTVTQSEEELKRLKSTTAALIERIEDTKTFRACRSPLCRWCEYEEICRRDL